MSAIVGGFGGGGTLKTLKQKVFQANSADLQNGDAQVDINNKLATQLTTIRQLIDNLIDPASLATSYRGIFNTVQDLPINLPNDPSLGDYAFVRSEKTLYFCGILGQWNINLNQALDDALLALIDSAPNDADTLNKLNNKILDLIDYTITNLALKQDKTDNGLTTASKDIIGSINENKANIDLKVDKIVGKGLSTEDYTTSEKTKLSNVEAQATKNQTDVFLLNRANHTGSQNASTISNFDSAVSANVDVLANSSARHIHSNQNVLDGTTASYTIAEKNKLSTVEEGAEVNVQADWNQTDNTQADFILNKPSIAGKKDRLNDALTRFASSSGVLANDGKDNDKPTTLQGAHDGINASGIINVATGTYQNSWNQNPVQTTLLNITKQNISIIGEGFPNGAKVEIKARTWTPLTLISAGDMVGDFDDANSSDASVRINARSWISKTTRTTGSVWNSTEKAFFDENLTIPLIKFSSTLRAQIKGITVRGKRAVVIENVPSSGAGVHSFEYCGDISIYLKTAFYGQLLVDNINANIEYDALINTNPLGSTVDIRNCNYVNLIKPRAILTIKNSQLINIDSIGFINTIIDIKNSRYINIPSHINGEVVLDSCTEVMNIVSTAIKQYFSGYDFNRLQITNCNFNYKNLTNGINTIGLLQKTGNCPHYIKNCIGLDVSQATYPSNFIINGESLVFPRTNAVNQSTPPTIADDITRGWDLNSTWTMSNGVVYTCYDNSVNNATWASSDNILPEVADKLTLEATYLIGFGGNTSSYAGKYISVVNANGLPLPSGNVSDGRTAYYQIKAGTSGNTASQLTYKSSIPPVQVTGSGASINDAVVSTSSTNSSSYIQSLVNARELRSNKVSTFSATTNNTNYPSEKLVKDSLDLKANDADVLHKTGNETSTGIKEFQSIKLTTIATITNATKMIVRDGSDNTLKEQLIPTQTASSSIPAGSIIMYGGVSAPTGFLFCHGQLISRSAYADLFNAIGITYGAGDNSTTFALPDMRGLFARGIDAGRGRDPNRALGSFQDFAMQNIVGHFNISNKEWNQSNLANASGPFGVEAGAALHNAGITNNWEGAKVNFDISRVVKTASETRPMNLALHYIIKT